jgi:hypothetical protein
MDLSLDGFGKPESHPDAIGGISVRFKKKQAFHWQWMALYINQSFD